VVRIFALLITLMAACVLVFVGFYLAVEWAAANLL
jgi:hypothetical protein